MGNLGYLPKRGSLSLLRQKRKLEPLAETMILARAHVAQSETASSSPLSRFDIPHPDRVDAAPLAVKRRLEIPAEPPDFGPLRAILSRLDKLGGGALCDRPPL